MVNVNLAIIQKKTFIASSKLPSLPLLVLSWYHQNLYYRIIKLSKVSATGSCEDPTWSMHIVHLIKVKLYFSSGIESMHSNECPQSRRLWFFIWWDLPSAETRFRWILRSLEAGCTSVGGRGGAQFYVLTSRRRAMRSSSICLSLLAYTSDYSHTIAKSMHPPILAYTSD